MALVVQRLQKHESVDVMYVAKNLLPPESVFPDTILKDEKIMKGTQFINLFVSTSVSDLNFKKYMKIRIKQHRHAKYKYKHVAQQSLRAKADSFNCRVSRACAQVWVDHVV